MRNPVPWLDPPASTGAPLEIAAVSLVQALGILLIAWLLNRLVRLSLDRLCRRYDFAPAFAIVSRVNVDDLILQRLGVSGASLWATLTGFIAVAAIAFFAAWSVLSNIFCALMILTTRPFRLNDEVELLESGDKPGLKGRVIDINFLHTTLHETNEDGSDTVLQVPNSQFFQKITRRWR